MKISISVFLNLCLESTSLKIVSNSERIRNSGLEEPPEHLGQLLSLKTLCEILVLYS